MGKSTETRAPHYYTLDEIVDEPTEHDKTQKEATHDELEATYSCTFDVPGHLSGKELEVFIPGPSADDSVRLNGKVIGEGLIDPETEWNYEADPLRWPNLPNRHYAVPPELLKPEGNLLEIQLNGQRLAAHTDKRFGLTRMFYLREKTPLTLQKKLAAYNRRMEFFRPVVDGPRAILSAEVLESDNAHTRRIKLANRGPVSAVFVVLDLENYGPAHFTFDEGALPALHPGESQVLHLHLESALKQETFLSVRSLNGDPLIVPLA